VKDLEDVPPAAHADASGHLIVVAVPLWLESHCRTRLKFVIIKIKWLSERINTHDNTEETEKKTRKSISNFRNLSGLNACWDTNRIITRKKDSLWELRFDIELWYIIYAISFLSLSCHRIGIWIRILSRVKESIMFTSKLDT
jgi:hypothetical protein